LDRLGTRFRGEAAVAFAEKMDTWKQAADGLVEGLEGMAGFLSGVAESFESVDTGLAAGLGGGGGSTLSDLIAADVEELRAMSKSFNRLSRTIDGDAQSLLSRLGLSRAEVGGAKTYDALQSFHNDWSDARKKLVSTADAASQFLGGAAASYEELDSELRSALTGEEPSSAGRGGGGGGGGGGGRW
jgi:uncharacterized protein YukE